MEITMEYIKTKLLDAYQNEKIVVMYITDAIKGCIIQFASLINGIEDDGETFGFYVNDDVLIGLKHIKKISFDEYENSYILENDGFTIYLSIL